MSNKPLVLQIANKEFELATKSLHEALGVIVQSKLDEKKKMIAASTFCEAKKPMSAKDAAAEAERLVIKRAGEYVKRKPALDKDLEDKRNNDTSHVTGDSFDTWKKKRAEGRKKIGLDEGRRLLGTHENGSRKAKVYRDSDTEEFVVQHYVDGKHEKKADYFASDKDDAHDTAKYWVNNPKGKSGVNEGLVKTIKRAVTRQRGKLKKKIEDELDKKHDAFNQNSDASKLDKAGRRHALTARYFRASGMPELQRKNPKGLAE